jgi:hypothetical protein
MSTYLSITRAAEDPDFNARIRGVLYKLAGDVIFEDPGTERHSDRVAMARGIRRFLTFDTPRFAWLAASNPSIASTIVLDTEGKVSVAAPDSDLEFVCSAAWTEVATEVWGQAR